ncbi:Sec-independent protein translocase protein TatB [Nocardia takedensis]
MLDGVGWSELMILLVAALIILGPERLPAAVRWTTDSLRQARDYLGGATARLREEIGPEVEEFRKPLAELRRLRGMTPQSVVSAHLLDDDTSLRETIDAVRELIEPEPIDVFNFGVMAPRGAQAANLPALDPVTEAALAAETPRPAPARPEKPPVDPDAT